MEVKDMKKARLELGLTQKQLAGLLGWSAQQVSNIENGKKSLQKQTALALECLILRQRVS